MTNNDIFKKLRVALMLRDEHIITILELVDFRISKTELSAFFRDEKHEHYKPCGDQILRNFLNGLVIFLRGSKEEPKIPGEILLALAGIAKPETNQQPKKITPSVKKNFDKKPKPKTTPIVENIRFKNGKKN